ncbi:MAG TPA: J domain-containing protein [Thermoanaerobaculia bacterium]|nr:J domain-containing protein [Thermoanaerobaculia bacterium]
MEIVAVLVMLVIGAGVAVFVMVALAIAKGERRRVEHVPAADRHEIAASILYQVLTSGGADPEDALRRLRREAGLGAKITRGVDLTNWGESYAALASPQERAVLLDTAVQFAAARRGPVPLRQYAALLDLTFALGFHTDALARLREKYGFTYVDHAKDARPREAGRGGGATTFFVRDDSRAAEYLHVLEIEGTPTRQTIISAYRRLVAQHHPDRFHGAPEATQTAEAARFIELTRAYEGLLAIYRD